MWYKPTEEQYIFGVAAIKHKLTKELCIFGKRGQIWQNNDNTFKVLINSGTQHPKKRTQDELVLTLDKSYIKEYTKFIKMPINVGRQVTLAKKWK